MSFLKGMSLKRKSLKYKILVAFSLMSIIPFLVLTYFVTNYFVEGMENSVQIMIIIITTLGVAFLGLMLTRQIILPVINLAIEVKIVSGGDYEMKLFSDRDDELGDIADAVNTMTGKIRRNIGELQEYRKRTIKLNSRIHRKVLTLTDLMRLGDMINAGAKFEKLTDFSTERLASEQSSGYCAIFMKDKDGKYFLKSMANHSRRDIAIGGIVAELEYLEKLLSKRDEIWLDSGDIKRSWQKELKDRLGDMNVIIIPMKLGSDIMGVIMTGNFENNTEFSEEDIEVIKAFEKELILGYQNTQAVEKAKNLEVIDSLTGLYSLPYLKNQIEDEIARSVYYQRPCSLMVVTLDDFKMYKEKHGTSKATHVLKQIGGLMSSLVTPISKVAREEDNKFYMLIPEMNKRESLEVAEILRARVERMELSTDENDSITVSIGVGENPIDGSTAEEIIEKACQYVEKASLEGKNRVKGE